MDIFHPELNASSLGAGSWPTSAHWIRLAIREGKQVPVA